MFTFAQLSENRTKALTEAQEIHKLPSLSKENRAKVDALIATATDLESQMDTAKKLESFEAESRAANIPARPAIGAETGTNDVAEKRAFSNYIKGRMTVEDRAHLRNPEQRDLQTAVGSAGGVTVPVGFDNLLHVVNKETASIVSDVRNWTSDSGEGIRVSLSDQSALRFNIVQELAAVTETDPVFAGFTSYVDTLGFSTAVSQQLLSDSAYSVESFLRDTIYKAYLNTVAESIIRGNGSNYQSLAAAAAVGYTMPTGGTSAVTYQSLLRLYGTLDPSFLSDAAFYMSSLTWVSLLGLVDSQNRPILTSDLQGKPFSNLLGLPIRVTQAMDQLGAGKSPIMLGSAARSYTFRQAGPMVVRRADEIYIATNRVGFFSFARSGGFSTIQASTPSMVKLVMSAT